jgi:hypothetical protein
MQIAMTSAKELENDYFTLVDNFVEVEEINNLKRRLKEIYDRDTDMSDFQQGQLGGGRTGGNLKYTLQHIRGDRVKWFQGTEADMESLQVCLKKVDSFIGCLKRYTLELKDKCIVRDSTMAAVYPAGAAGYIRHVDNPHGNGRVLVNTHFRMF